MPHSSEIIRSSHLAHFRFIHSFACAEREYVIFAKYRAPQFSHSISLSSSKFPTKQIHPELAFFQLDATFPIPCNRFSKIAMQLPFTPYTVAWQHLVCLLYAIENVQGGIPSKASTIDFIRRNGLLRLRPEDRKPYLTCTEESWITDIAWSRKSGVIAGLVRYDEWNCWEISKEGRAALNQLLPQNRESPIDVRKCFLWHSRFKLVFDPSYTESSLDLKAPPKGERRIDPDPEKYLAAVEMALEFSEASITELAKNVSKNLGHPVAASKVSIATAFAFREVNERLDT